MDNEVSKLLKQYHEENTIDIQLAPPHMHRQNAAERGIRTWKDHFVSIRAACDPDFPKKAWCRLIPHSERTLNLLWASRTQPKTNAYTILYGMFNYQQTPIAQQEQR